MKKVLAIFFCLQIITANSFAVEIMKTPFLIQHFLEHKTIAHSHLDFGAFLWGHYINDNHSDESEGPCKEKLPFKHCHDCCTHMSVVITYLIPNNNIVINFKNISKEHNFTGKTTPHSLYSCCIWKPPQIG